MKPATTAPLRRLAVPLLVVLFLLPAPAVQAQITITAADLQALAGPTYRITVYEATSLEGLQAAADATGANRTYDLSGVAFQALDTGTIEILTSGAGIPGADDPAFAQANYFTRITFRDSTNAAADSIAWQIARLQADGIFGLGLVSRFDVDEDGAPDTLKARFSPPYQFLALPLTVGKTWTAATKFSTDFGGFQFDVEFSDSNAVDGFGTLVTPTGSAAVLRYYSESVTRTFGIVDTSTTVEFISKDNRLSASIELDANGTVTGASYTRYEVVPRTSTERPDGVLPEAFTLHQNYPNPLNPSTLIPFELKVPAHVTLRVVDLMGREVAVLVDGMKEAGSHTARFEASDLPSGQYVYVLRSGGTAQARLLTVIK